MKTEQEQIKELTRVMLEASDSANVEPVFECENGEEIRLNSGATSILNDILEQAFIPYLAQKLVNAGYGDVSEYKAEIERLKAKNKVLGDGVAKAFTNGFNTGREQVEKDIRRAKINTMIELKEKIVEHMGEREYMGVKYKQGVFSESEIDELIKEVQNGEDKG